MITPPQLYADLNRARDGGIFELEGYTFDKLAWAISFAVATWLKTGGVLIKGVSTGTAGAGAINVPTTRLVLVSNPPLVIGGLMSAGMLGPLSVSLGMVVSKGLAKTFTKSGQYAGGVVGVGVGVDVSKAFVVNPPLLIAQLLAYMTAMMGAGPAAAQMATGLGTGISAHLLTLTGTGTVVGPPSPASAMGQSTSVVI